MVSMGLLVMLLLPLVGTGVGYYLGLYSERQRNVFNVLITAINWLLITAYFPIVVKAPVTLYIRDIMGTGLHLKLDIFRYVFVWITGMVWFLTTLYTTQYLIRYRKRNRYYSFFMLTYASTIGIFISDNFLNLFTFFEIMSLASYVLVIHDEDEYSHEAGVSYLSMALAGGLVLLTGLILLYDYTGTLLISDLTSGLDHIGNVRYLIVFLIIIGFGVKSSMVPLHTWLSKAYPAAPTPATAVLSGVLVKTGLFGIMIAVFKLMSGDPYVSLFVIGAGCINIIHGGVLAIMQRNIKRILAYSSMSQVGYILIGIGLVGILGDHGSLALIGALMHVVNHAFFKVLLFMGVGIIYMIMQDLSINKIGGFGRNKALMRWIFLIGCLATMGMPGTCGFISKTLLHEAIIEAKHLYDPTLFSIVESVFVVGAGMTVAYLMKIFVAVFVESNERFQGQFKRHVRKRALLPMAILSLGIIWIGLQPQVLYKALAWIPAELAMETGHMPHFYTLDTLIGFLIPFAIGNVIYFVYVRGCLRVHQDGKWIYHNPSLKWVELERDLYRPVTILIYRVSSMLLKIVDRGIINGFILLKNGLFNMLHIKFNYQNMGFNGGIVKELDASVEKVQSGKLATVRAAGDMVSWSNEAVQGIRDRSVEQSRSVREIFLLTGSNLNSLVYTVLTFIFVLVGILVLMMLK